MSAKKKYIGSDLEVNYYTQLKGKAKQREISFNLDFKKTFELLEKQNNKCKLTNIEISLEEKTASLDRKDSSKGYLQNNVQWIHRKINYMKGDASDESTKEFIQKIKDN